MDVNRFSSCVSSFRNTIKRLADLYGHPATKRQRVFHVAFLWLMLLSIFLILRFVYLSFGIGVPCPLHAVTGLYCPGCGMFRAAVSLMRVDIWQAIRYNALSVILLPLLFLSGIRETARYIRAAFPAPAGRLEMVVIVGVAVASVIYGVARNLPVFAMLRPTGIILNMKTLLPAR